MNPALAVVLVLLGLSTSEDEPESGNLSPAEQKVQWAREAIEQHPSQFQGYNELVVALAQRARETSDPRYYLEAQAALQKSFELKPDNLEGRKGQVWILLGQREFAKAVELARSLNQKVPDDISIYGFLVDANVELGNYAEAERAGQWMLDIRPGNVPGLTRGARLRALFGDLDGAADLLRAAYQQVQATEVEERASMLTELAHLRLLSGGVDDAEKLLRQALQLFPNYDPALGNLAKIFSARGREAESAALLQQQYQLFPLPENAYALAESLERAGRHREARRIYREFERKAREQLDRANNANRELIFYYADHAHRPAEALRIARLEIARRQDLNTLDALAWALFVNHRYPEARQRIDAALAVGVRDTKLLYHARAIAKSLSLAQK